MMVTKLEKPLRREIAIDREPWVVTITPLGLVLARKGRRKGFELDWKGIVSGDAPLAAALNAAMRERAGSLRGRDAGSTPRDEADRRSKTCRAEPAKGVRRP
jgi:hypothetical protein